MQRGEGLGPSATLRTCFLRSMSQLHLTSPDKPLYKEPAQPGATPPVRGRQPRVKVISMATLGSPRQLHTALCPLGR